MHRCLALSVLVLVPVLAGCTLLGPGEFYDVTVETEAAGQVLAAGTPASNAQIFVALRDAGAEEPVPPNRTRKRQDAEPDSVLKIPANMSKAIWRLRLDAQGQVAFRVPTARPADLVVRVVETPPPFHVSEDECPRPQKLRSILEDRRLAEDGPVRVTFTLVCGSGDGS